ncbi:MAG: SDR family NAD(P)-dependent oxidoreductase [bacterium]
MTDFIAKYGQWALVTGASSGIGAEFSRQLGEKGLNLVLVARRKEILDAKAEDLKDAFGIEVMTIGLDLTETNAIQKLYEKAKNIDIGLVVPNAGMATEGNFSKIPLEEQNQVLVLNCMVPMQMAHLFGQRLIERGRGGIIFVASTFGYQAVPYFANYAASKSYILTFGESLHYEFKRNGIDVTVLSPGLTSTAMPDSLEIDFSKLPMKAMPVEPVVTRALDSLEQNKASVIPGMMNNSMAFMAQRLMSRERIASMFGDMNRKALPKEKI